MNLLLAALFGAAGVALGAINVWNNATQVNGGQFVFNDLTAVVCGLAIAGALLSLSLGSIAQRSRITTALAVVAVIGCAATSVGYTLGRVGSAADSGVAEALAHNARIARAEQLVAKLDAERRAEAADGGCGRECRKIEERLDAAREALNVLGVRQVADPAGERLEAVTGGWISADGYRTAHPVIVAGSLELGVSLLLTIAGLFGAGGRRPAPRIIDVTPADPVRAVLQQQSQPLTNRQLAKLAQVSEATACRAVKALAATGQVVKHREGRAMMIRYTSHD